VTNHADAASQQRTTHNAQVAGLLDEGAGTALSKGVEFLHGNAYTSRPGARLVEAAERLAALIER
jgi:hypothetical protein